MQVDIMTRTGNAADVQYIVLYEDNDRLPPPPAVQVVWELVSRQTQLICNKGLLRLCKYNLYKKCYGVR